MRNLKGMTFSGLAFERSEFALYVLYEAERSYIPNLRFALSTSL